MLSQQRFINMLSALNDYSIKDKPDFIFQYKYDTKKNADSSFGPNDYSYFTRLHTFPGFGMHVDTLSLNLSLPSDEMPFLTDEFGDKYLTDSTYLFNRYNASLGAEPLVKPNNQFKFFSDQDDGVIRYNFSFLKQKSLQDWLFDFRGGKMIGSIQIINHDHPIDKYAIKTLTEMFSKEKCSVFIRILLHNDKIHDVNPCIDIPIDVKIKFVIANIAEIELTTKNPEMSNVYF